MNTEACAYPFLYEDEHLADYEIETDLLCSYLGMCYSLKNDKIFYDLMTIAYELNGSVRGKNTIDDKKLEKWLNIYEDLKKYEVKFFIYPQGTEISSMLHICRSHCKKCIRTLFFVSKEIEVDKNIFELLNILSNLLFLLALKYNREQNIAEIEFISNNY